MTVVVPVCDPTVVWSAAPPMVTIPFGDEALQQILFRSAVAMGRVKVDPAKTYRTQLAVVVDNGRFERLELLVFEVDK